MAPGIYARAFLEGRITEDQMHNFRKEVEGKGLSSYPHPWLMPDFWQFPTVSMGLGPLMAIYQARFLKYLQDRSVLPDQVGSRLLAVSLPASAARSAGRGTHVGTPASGPAIRVARVVVAPVTLRASVADAASLKGVPCPEC